jgi:hypothetical protein
MPPRRAKRASAVGDEEDSGANAEGSELQYDEKGVLKTGAELIEAKDDAEDDESDISSVSSDGVAKEKSKDDDVRKAKTKKKKSKKQRHRHRKKVVSSSSSSSEDDRCRSKRKRRRAPSSSDDSSSASSSSSEDLEWEAFYDHDTVVKVRALLKPPKVPHDVAKGRFAIDASGEVLVFRKAAKKDKWMRETRNQRSARYADYTVSISRLGHTGSDRVLRRNI